MLIIYDNVDLSSVYLFLGEDEWRGDCSGSCDVCCLFQRYIYIPCSLQWCYSCVYNGVYSGVTVEFTVLTHK